MKGPVGIWRLGAIYMIHIAATHLMLLLALAIGALPAAVAADADPGPFSVSESCPDAFDIVDLGQWGQDEQGNPALDYGGVLYRVTPFTGSEIIRCVSPDALGGRRQFLDGRPVPLVTSLVDGDLGRRFIQRSYGDYVQDVVKGSITQHPSQQSAFEAVEGKRRAQFTGWTATADDDRYVLDQGTGYACLREPNNPQLEGDGNYTCLANIEGMPHPDTFFRCAQFGGGCYAEFSLEAGISIRLNGGPLRHWSEAASARSIQEAVTFWSVLVLATIENFQSGIVPRVGIVIERDQ